MKFRHLAAACAAAAIVCVAQPSNADNLKFGVHVGNTVYLASVLLPLDGGATVVSFTNPTAGIVSITFNAKCSVTGPNNSYSDLDVIVDGAAVAPTSGAFDVFCSAFNGLTRSSVTVAKSLGAGTHNVRIRAATYNSATSAFIGDSTLLISR